MSAFSFKRNLLSWFALLVCIFPLSVQAQSLDARSPSPIRSNEIVGRIAARDLGDSRLTDHFYAFTGTPGDLVITVETQNLNGDMDVFTASGLRPVLKVALYAETGSPVSKSVYLRAREDLILRIEARTPNDDEGIYRIRFGGSFEPIVGAAEETEEANASSETSTTPPRRGKRVSSVGARINEPAPVEVAAAPTPEPTPAATPEVVEPKAEPSTESAPKPTNARTRPTSRRTRGKTTTAATQPSTTESPTEAKTAEDTSTTGTITREEPASEVKSKAPRKGRNTTKKSDDVAASSVTESSTPKARNAKGAASPQPEAGETQPPAEGESKLIIELMDGSRIERPMTEIRRVTLESGQVVVVGRDGNVERIRMARVLRMSIGQ